MSELPMDLVGRVRLRRQLLREAVIRARNDWLTTRMSLNCEAKTKHGIHPIGRPGCKNDGSGCLCECHDPIPVAAGVSPETKEDVWVLGRAVKPR